MTQFSYTREACAALVKNPEDRTAGLKAMVEKLGGRHVCLYYCFGDYDGIAIGEYPDETTAAAAILAVIGAGHLKATKTTQLLTVEQAMEAMRKASSLAYAAPKG
jgi:uncharacterized protein with GYD domain